MSCHTVHHRDEETRQKRESDWSHCDISAGRRRTGSGADLYKTSEPNPPCEVRPPKGSTIFHNSTAILGSKCSNTNILVGNISHTNQNRGEVMRPVFQVPLTCLKMDVPQRPHLCFLGSISRFFLLKVGPTAQVVFVLGCGCRGVECTRGKGTEQQGTPKVA